MFAFARVTELLPCAIDLDIDRDYTTTWFLASLLHVLYYNRKATTDMREADTHTVCFRQGNFSKTITPLCCGRPEVLLHSTSCNSASGRPHHFGVHAIHVVHVYIYQCLFVVWSN